MNDHLHIAPPIRLAEALRRRGWSQSYRDEAFLSESVGVLENDYSLTEVWRNAVARFGGFRFTFGGERGRGMAAMVTTDPMIFASESDLFLDFSNEFGKMLLPFAAVENDAYPFAIDGDGGGHLLAGPLHYWPDFLVGIDSLVFDKRCSCQTCRNSNRFHL